MPAAFFEQENQPVGSFPHVSVENTTNYTAHFHEEIEIAYVKKGDICAFSDSKEINLKDGDICFFMPGEIHSFTDKNSSDMSIVKMGVQYFVEDINFEKIRLKNNKFSIGDEFYEEIKNILDNIFEEYEKKELGYEFAIRKHKNDLITVILRKMKYNIVDTAKSTQLLNLINKYLENNFASEITLEEMAKYCHFSKYYFAHKLKKVTGMSFIQYLTTYRTRRAARMLANTDVKITEIALNCGFNNLRSFNRAFLSTYNMTPSAYRKLEKQV